MDPNKTSSPTSKSVKERSSRFSLLRLWQVPVFFMGVAAFFGACYIRGLVAPDPVRQLHNNLSETRRLLEQDTNDPEAALPYAQQAVENLACDPKRTAEAYFLLGSTHLRIAERLSSEPPNTELRTQHLTEARRCLLEADRSGLDGEDGNRLHYRLAKIGFFVGDDPVQVVAQLKATAEVADDRAEALSLLSRAYLRLNPPNVKEALKANRKLREEVPQIGEDVLGPAKLAGAKLLLQLNQREEARKTLEKINDRAVPAVLTEKNMLLAGLYQEEHKWTQAAQMWRAALDDKQKPLTEAGGVLYNLGVCYRNMDQGDKAVQAWNECMSRSQGEEGQAAALALAEVRLHESNPEKAVALLAEAVAKIRKADDWKNSLKDLADVRELFEQAITVYRQAKLFDLAVRTAELYERVAAPPKAQLRRAELNSEWAKVVRERGRSAQDEDTRKKDEATADELLRQAAEAHAEAARLLSEKKECADHHWLSAVCSFEGHDYPRAADKLREIVEHEKEDIDRLGEGLFLLGETCRFLHDLKAAETAYKMCVERGARFTYRARYQLAMMEIEAGKIDSAEKELEQNILIEQRDTDPEAQEKSRLALCALQYQKAATLPAYYRRVVHNLEGHLDHFAVTADSVRARFQLADSYRQQVDQDTLNRNVLNSMKSTEANEHYFELNRRMWTRAAEEFAKLEELIKEPELAKLLSIKQQMDIPIYVGECYYNLGQYEKALRKFEELAKKWGQTPHGLYAFACTMRCFSSMGDFEHLRRRAAEVRHRMDETKGMNDSDRQRYLSWLEVALKPPLDETSRKSNNEQPKIINMDRDKPQIIQEGGPVFDPQRR
jgi:tetratricopeptide (TPR) repeat protein